MGSESIAHEAVRCGQNGATCPYITNGLTSYTFYATGETRSITSHITCNTKNVIYMVQCTLFSFIFAGLKFRENFLGTFRESLISRSRRKIVFAGNLISRN